MAEEHVPNRLEPWKEAAPAVDRKEQEFDEWPDGEANGMEAKALQP